MEATNEKYSLSLSLPQWAIEELEEIRASNRVFATPEEKMDLVMRFARRNFEQNTGGPFAAGVFERATGKMVMVGVNRVLASNCSSAHAEFMALSLAQKAIQSYDLGGVGQPEHEFVVNWRPCAMCYGSVLWSGVRSLVIAGNGPELEQHTGFDEGPVRSDWREQLEKRGIKVTMDVRREDAVKLWMDFGRSTNMVYNARLGSTTATQSTTRHNNNFYVHL